MIIESESPKKVDKKEITFNYPVKPSAMTNVSALLCRYLKSLYLPPIRFAHSRQRVHGGYNIRFAVERTANQKLSAISWQVFSQK
jgi:hypothetical protein